MSTFFNEQLETLPRPDLVIGARLPRGSEVNMAFVARTRETAYQVIIGSEFRVGLLPEKYPQGLGELFDEEIALIKKLAEELQS